MLPTSDEEFPVVFPNNSSQLTLPISKAKMEVMEATKAPNHVEELKLVFLRICDVSPVAQV